MTKQDVLYLISPVYPTIQKDLQNTCPRVASDFPLDQEKFSDQITHEINQHTPIPEKKQQPIVQVANPKYYYCTAKQTSLKRFIILYMLYGQATVLWPGS